MKSLILLLLVSYTCFSQIEKKKEPTVSIKKPLVISKEILPKTGVPILNDSVIRFSKKALKDAPLKEKELSYNVGFCLLNSCNTSKIRKFTKEEFTPQLLKKIDLNYISNICVNNNETYGKFISLNLEEVITIENTKVNIYRYKITYTRKILSKELRIYINSKGLISVIKTMKWKNNFELKKKPKPRSKKIIDSLQIDNPYIIDESLIIKN